MVRAQINSLSLEDSVSWRGQTSNLKDKPRCVITPVILCTHSISKLKGEGRNCDYTHPTDEKNWPSERLGSFSSSPHHWGVKFQVQVQASYTVLLWGLSFIAEVLFCWFLWQHCLACGILVPRPGIEPAPSAVRAQSPNHWTAREFPSWSYKSSAVRH